MNWVGDVNKLNGCRSFDVGAISDVNKTKQGDIKTWNKLRNSFSVK